MPCRSLVPILVTCVLSFTGYLGASITVGDSTLEQTRGGSLVYCSIAIGDPFSQPCTQCNFSGMFTYTISYPFPDPQHPTVYSYTIPIYSRCANTPMQTRCMGGPSFGTSTCDTGGTALCAGQTLWYVFSYTDSACSMGTSAAMEFDPNFPHGTCSATYRWATPGTPVTGVDCSSMPFPTWY